MNRWTGLPVLCVIALYAMVSPSPWIAVGLAALLVIGLALPRKATATKLVEALLSTFLLVMGTVVLTTLLPNGRSSMNVIRGSWAAFAAATLLVTVARFYLERPIGGDGINLALCLLVLTVCGGSLTGVLYPLGVVLCLGAAFYARRRADRGHAPADGVRRQWRQAIALFLVGGGLATGAVTILPPMHEWAMRKMWMRAIPTSGFSDRLYLGSLRGMLLSDEKVMRIRGDGVDHLRGIVFRAYEAGRWRADPESMVAYDPLRDPSGAGDEVEIEVLDDEPRRYFFPLGAADVRVSSGFARHDDLGVVAPIAAEPADRLWFRPGEHAYPIAPPEAADLEVGRDVRAYLVEWLRRSDITEGTPEERVQRVLEELQRSYAYSLEYESGRYHDPTIDFLFSGKQGHCEYFASAFALLSRVLGIPARVIGGYRVFEKNPLGDYWIVRERNAHTWVELWIDGGWQTWDPTPPGELVSTMQGQTPTMAALLDLGGTAWAAFLSWLDRRTWTEMGVGASVVLLGPIALRWLVLRRRRREEEDHERPLPCFEELAELLTGYGVAPKRSETIEQHARRVETAELPEELREAAATLLRRYAALRYGKVGEPSRLDGDVAAFTKRWAR